MTTLETFLRETLTTDELQTLCHAYFPDLPATTPTQDLTSTLLAQVQATQNEEKLYTALQALYPRQVASAFPQGFAPAPPPAPPAIEWRERFPWPVRLGLFIGLLTTLALALIIANVDPPLPPPNPYAPTSTTTKILTSSGPILTGQTATGNWNREGQATFSFADGPGQFDFVLTATNEAVNPAILLFDATNLQEPLFTVDFANTAVEAWRYVTFTDNRAYSLVLQGDPGAEFTLTVTQSWPQPITLDEEVTGELEGANPAVYALRQAPAQLTIRAQISDPAAQPRLYLLTTDGQELAFSDDLQPDGTLTLTNVPINPAGQEVRIFLRDARNQGTPYTLRLAP